MIVKEGQRVRLTGRAWGTRGREVFAYITFADHAYAKIDDQEVLVSGGMVNGFEFEVADSPLFVFEDVTRIVVVTETGGRVIDWYGYAEGGVELHLQDDGRTLKIFPRREES